MALIGSFDTSNTRMAGIFSQSVSEYHFDLMLSHFQYGAHWSHKQVILGDFDTNKWRVAGIRRWPAIEGDL